MLNRLELSRLEPTRYHKISHNPMAIRNLRNLLVDLFGAGGRARFQKARGDAAQDPAAAA
jgi:hypothetical protein